MIKFIKIENQRNNAPEIEMRPIAKYLKADKGTIFALKDNVLNHNNSNSAHAGFYYCMDDKDANDPNRMVRCFRITNDMLFEFKLVVEVFTPVCGKGLNLNFYSTESGTFDFIESNGSPDAIIVDTSQYSKNKKLILRFSA